MRFTGSQRAVYPEAWSQDVANQIQEDELTIILDILPYTTSTGFHALLTYDNSSTSYLRFETSYQRKHSRKGMQTQTHKAASYHNDNRFLWTFSGQYEDTTPDQEDIQVPRRVAYRISSSLQGKMKIYEPDGSGPKGGVYEDYNDFTFSRDTNGYGANHTATTLGTLGNDPNGYHFVLGSRLSASTDPYRFNGYLSHVRLYKRALTDEEMSAEMSLDPTEVPDAGAGGVIGDPIVVPIHGKVYALPCDNHVYRYLGDNSGRVVLNVQHELSNKLTVQEIEEYCESTPQAKQYAEVLKSAKNIQPYSFPRYVYMAVEGHEVAFDLHNLIPIKPLQNGTKIHTAVGRKSYITDSCVDPIFSIKRVEHCNEGIGCKKFNMYNDEKGLRVVISVETKTYGRLDLNLFSFSNKQLRTGISIRAEKPVTLENSIGAIVSPMIAKDCRLKKLHSLKKIHNSMRQPKLSKMTFIESNGRKTVQII